MGKASRLKKEKTLQPQAMNPVLMEAFIRGRNAGEKTGKVDGYAEAMTKYHVWTDEIDQHVKGIGPKMKAQIEEYYAKRIQENIEKNK